MKETTKIRIEELAAVAEALAETHDIASATLLSGLLVHDGLLTLADAIEKVGDLNMAAETIARAIPEPDIERAAKTIATAVNGVANRT